MLTTSDNPAEKHNFVSWHRVTSSSLSKVCWLMEDSILWHLTQAAQKSFKHFQSLERDLVNKYNLVVGLWKRVS